MSDDPFPTLELPVGWALAQLSHLPDGTKYVTTVTPAGEVPTDDPFTYREDDDPDVTEQSIVVARLTRPVKRRLVIELEVMTDHSDLPDVPSDIVAGMIEGLPEPWFDPDDGDDLWLSYTWTARWADES